MIRCNIGGGTTYRPLDELLESPRVQILRRMRHFDWATADDIALALDTEPGDAFNKALSRLVAQSLVDRRGDGVWMFTYRINARGNAELEKILARSMLPETWAVPE